MDLAQNGASGLPCIVIHIHSTRKCVFLYKVHTMQNMYNLLQRCPEPLREAVSREMVPDLRTSFNRSWDAKCIDALNAFSLSVSDCSVINLQCCAGDSRSPIFL